jgi:hypothetical protein
MVIRKHPGSSPCPECHHPGRDRAIRKVVTLSDGRSKQICFYCASGYVSIPGVTIQPS